MPPPLLSTLSQRARTAFPIIRGGVARGLSANSIQSLLRAEGLGIRRTDLLSIIRAERGIEVAASRLRTMRRDRSPDPRRLPDALHKIRRAFSFDVKISGFDLETGADVTQFVNVALDDPLTRGEIENLALSLIDAQAQRYGFAVTDVIIERGLKAGVEGTVFTPDVR